MVCTPLTSAQSEGNGDATLAESLLDLGHVDRAVIFGTRLCSNGIDCDGNVGKIRIWWDIEEGKGIAALPGLTFQPVPARSTWSSQIQKWIRQDIAGLRPKWTSPRRPAG